MADNKKSETVKCYVSSIYTKDKKQYALVTFCLGDRLPVEVPIEDLPEAARYEDSYLEAVVSGDDVKFKTQDNIKGE